MIAPSEKRRIAIAAPVMHLVIGSVLLVLAARPAELMIPMLVAAAMLPAVVGWWVFAGRPALSRTLLATWAPAGEVFLLVLAVLSLRPSGVSQGLFVALVIGPLLLLFVFGVLALRGQSRKVQALVAALWVLTLAEVALAVPLSERFGSTEDMQAITAVVILLLAPAAALGAWGGLALAARVPEPVRPGEKADLLEPAAGAASIGEPSVEEPPSGEPVAHKGEPQ